MGALLLLLAGCAAGLPGSSSASWSRAAVARADPGEGSEPGATDGPAADGERNPVAAPGPPADAAMADAALAGGGAARARPAGGPPVGPAARVWPSGGDCLGTLARLAAAAERGELPAEPTGAPLALLEPPGARGAEHLRLDLAVPRLIEPDAAGPPCRLALALEPAPAEPRVVGRRTIWSERAGPVERRPNPDYEAARRELQNLAEELDREERAQLRDVKNLTPTGNPLIDALGVVGGLVLGGIGSAARDRELAEAEARLRAIPRTIEETRFEPYELLVEDTLLVRRATLEATLLDRDGGWQRVARLPLERIDRLQVAPRLHPRDRSRLARDGRLVDPAGLEALAASPPPVPLSELLGPLAERFAAADPVAGAHLASADRGPRAAAAADRSGAAAAATGSTRATAGGRTPPADAGKRPAERELAAVAPPFSGGPSVRPVAPAAEPQTPGGPGRSPVALSVGQGRPEGRADATSAGPRWTVASAADGASSSRATLADPRADPVARRAGGSEVPVAGATADPTRSGESGAARAGRRAGGGRPVGSRAPAAAGQPPGGPSGPAALPGVPPDALVAVTGAAGAARGFYVAREAVVTLRRVLGSSSLARIEAADGFVTWGVLGAGSEASELALLHVPRAGRALPVAAAGAVGPDHPLPEAGLPLLADGRVVGVSLDPAAGRAAGPAELARLLAAVKGSRAGPGAKSGARGRPGGPRGTGLRRGAGRWGVGAPDTRRGRSGRRAASAGSPGGDGRAPRRSRPIGRRSAPGGRRARGGACRCRAKASALGRGVGAVPGPMARPGVAIGSGRPGARRKPSGRGRLVRGFPLGRRRDGDGSRAVGRPRTRRGPQAAGGGGSKRGRPRLRTGIGPGEVGEVRRGGAGGTVRPQRSCPSAAAAEVGSGHRTALAPPRAPFLRYRGLRQVAPDRRRHWLLSAAHRRADRSAQAGPARRLGAGRVGRARSAVAGLRWQPRGDGRSAAEGTRRSAPVPGEGERARPWPPVP